MRSRYVEGNLTRSIRRNVDLDHPRGGRVGGWSCPGRRHGCPLPIDDRKDDDLVRPRDRAVRRVELVTPRVNAGHGGRPGTALGGSETDHSAGHGRAGPSHIAADGQSRRSGRSLATADERCAQQPKRTMSGTSDHVRGTQDHLRDGPQARTVNCGIANGSLTETGAVSNYRRETIRKLYCERSIS